MLYARDMLILGFYRVQDDKVFCLIKGESFGVLFFSSPGFDGGRIFKAQLLLGKRTTASGDCRTSVLLLGKAEV